ncbi:hypothetical protein M9H77_34318 [Catharanthus roseus]|uniref:Uncharacterized protein n=1 Tax=Catharanthus roseus TaxID=4058 RepID=A0ACB9ZLJ5_CATRO|nr:hypothetical protein M9H77_34318 [Catharanthus roseus]
MDSFEEFLQENVGCEMDENTGKLSPIWGDEDPNRFEEFLEPEEYIDLGHLFTTNRIFSSKDELVDWAKQTAMKAKTYLIINRYQRSRIVDRRPYVILACKHREFYDICSAQKIYSVVAKIKRNRIQERNTAEEFLCLSAQKSYGLL